MLYAERKTGTELSSDVYYGQKCDNSACSGDDVDVTLT